MCYLSETEIFVCLYLFPISGEDKSTWADYDASLLLTKYDGPERHILVDQVKKSFLL